MASFEKIDVEIYLFLSDGLNISSIIRMRLFLPKNIMDVTWNVK